MEPLGSRLGDPGPEVADLLRGLGYTRDLIRRDYPVWMGSAVSRLPVVGFARARPKDMTTATIVAARSSDSNVDDLFSAARILASPVVLLSRDSQVELWSIPSNPGAEQQINAVPGNELGRFSGLYRSALNPDNLLAAKTSYSQLSLFPVDVNLLPSARRGLFNQLISRVREAAIIATTGASQPSLYLGLPHGHLSQRRTRRSAEHDLEQQEKFITGSQAVVGALTALMIRDKFGLTSSGFDLLADATRLYPDYFQSIEPALRREGIDLPYILDILGSDINYEALDPRIVGQVYEEAIVDEDERLRSGIFHTPPELAKSILQHLPIEQVPPDRRVILDPACGSGTLLLAAYDRLQELTPIRWEPDVAHSYVTRLLHGIDRDQFAVDIARLALLLNSLPEGNHWDVRRRDTLTTQMRGKQRPMFIVSNPPWRDIRSIGGRRHQVADDFLRWTLDTVRPGGFFAIVLPSAWLSSSTSASFREQVQERAEVFEVWRLPDDTFPSARTAPCVLFGQVRSAHEASTKEVRPWIFRRILRSSSKEFFYQTGIADETYLGLGINSLRTDTYLRGPLDDAAKRLHSMPTLQSIATVQNGPVPEPPVAIRGGAGDFLWLKSGRMLPAFGSLEPSDLIPVRFPDEFHRAGSHDGSIFRLRKLIISGDRSPANPWRLKVGLDNIGVIPRDSLHMVIPQDVDDYDTALYALLAIFGSAFAAAWIDAYCTKLAIETRLIRDMPIPPPGEVWSKLASQGRQLVEAADSPALLAARAKELDEIVFRSYRLPERVRRSMTAHFAGFTAPEGAVRYPEPLHTAVVNEAAPVRTFGAVLGVDQPGTLRLWVPGLTPDEGISEPVPRRFLGWHCVKGATFDVESYGSLYNANYKFQRRAYQDFDIERDDLSEVSDLT
jgi:hypothetical protein